MATAQLQAVTQPRCDSLFLALSCRPSRNRFDLCVDCVTDGPRAPRGKPEVPKYQPWTGQTLGPDQDRVGQKAARRKNPHQDIRTCTRVGVRHTHGETDSDISPGRQQAPHDRPSKQNLNPGQRARSLSLRADPHREAGAHVPRYALPLVTATTAAVRLQRCRSDRANARCSAACTDGVGNCRPTFVTVKAPTPYTQPGLCAPHEWR